MSYLNRMARNHPSFHYFVIVLLGGAFITVGIDLVAFWVGGMHLLEKAGIVSVSAGALWFVAGLLRMKRQRAD